MSHSTLGVDIAKAQLDVYLAPAGRTAQFPNDPAGFRALLRWLGKTPVRYVVYEPTGPWHRPFEHTLLNAQLPLAQVNPYRARRFAQANGKRAKTDPIDAQMLAQMGMALPLRQRRPVPQVQRDLQELHAAREALTKERTAALNRDKHLQQSLLKRQNKARLRQLDAHLKAIDARMHERLTADTSRAREVEILTSIPGISHVTAAGILAQLPELGSLDAKSLASLAGLAPVTRQSGTWRGRSFIQGGRQRLRRSLYMPAIAAIRCNPDLRKKYRQLTAAGKPPKVALTAVMRKLLILANTLVQQNRLWAPQPGLAGTEATA